MRTVAFDSNDLKITASENNEIIKVVIPVDDPLFIAKKGRVVVLGFCDTGTWQYNTEDSSFDNSGDHVAGEESAKFAFTTKGKNIFVTGAAQNDVLLLSR